MALPPPGFEPVMIWKGTPDNEVISPDEVAIGQYRFLTNTPLPMLPLKAVGKINHMSWDIPTRWAIDSNNDCWMDNAHGGNLCKYSREHLLATAEEDGSHVQIRAVLGLKPKMPAWAKAAKDAGWIPPATWDPNQYEE